MATHAEHSAKTLGEHPSTPCNANHITFGGYCLNWRLVVRDADGNEVEHPDSPSRWVESDSKPESPAYTIEWEPLWREGEGKARELDAARRSAIWLDATDDDLTAPGLNERLEARFPALLAEFKHDMEELGFTF